MKRAHVLLAALSCMTATAFAEEKKPADQLEKLTVDGKERTMLVYAPKGLPKKDAPLVISLHGFRQDAFFQRGQSHWNDCADENKFVVVYPNAIDTWWDVGGMRDVKFIEAVIEEMAKRYKIDRKRIYVTGFSLGAMMTYQCMEHLSTTVAAFGPVSGVRFDNRPPKSDKPVSFLHVHGTGDNVFWWKGDLKHPAGGYPSIPEYVEKWAKHQKLDLKTEKKNYPRNDSRASLTTWKKLGSKVEIGLLALEDKGHWHSEDPAHSASTTSELWSFFKRHPLQTPSRKTNGTAHQAGTSSTTTIRRESRTNESLMPARLALSRIPLSP